MICKIADLGVDVPDVGNLKERCKPYLADIQTDITLDERKMRPNHWEKLSTDDNYYLESGFQFYRELLRFDGLMLHASAVVVEGKAYLFSGPCGVGKSTHTAKYVKTFKDAVIINDDKPAIRQIDGVWYAFGTPWCGKDGINVNSFAPLAGICFLHRGDTQINRLNTLSAVTHILRQTNGRGNAEQASLLMGLLNRLVQDVPIFEFYNHAYEGDENITYNTMKEAFERGEREK